MRKYFSLRCQCNQFVAASEISVGLTGTIKEPFKGMRLEYTQQNRVRH